MLYCNNCKITVTGDKPLCPLCGAELAGEGEPETSVYPDIPPPKYSRNFLLRLVSFIAFTGIAVSVALNYIFSPEIWWSLFVSVGFVCSWLTLAVGITKRSNILKNITWQLFLVTALAVIWDLLVGWHGWSLDFVLPGSCLVSMVSMFVISKIMKIPARELVFYLVLDSLYGIVPIIFVLTGILSTVIPSIVCILCSVISISAILLFEWKDIRDVFARKFHV